MFFLIIGSFVTIAGCTTESETDCRGGARLARDSDTATANDDTGTGTTDGDADTDSDADTDTDADSDLGLHVQGQYLLNGNNEPIILRGPELVWRWGEYSGITPEGVDVPWEEGRNGTASEQTIREIAKTGANAMRHLGGFADELEANLNIAVKYRRQ